MHRTEHGSVHAGVYEAMSALHVKADQILGGLALLLGDVVAVCSAEAGTQTSHVALPTAVETQTDEVEKLVESSSAYAHGVVHAECQAIDSVIRAECVASAPEAFHRSEFQKKVKEHQTRYPGGRLPNDLHGFSDYMKVINARLDVAERAKMKCLSCGQYPWT